MRRGAGGTGARTGLGECRAGRRRAARMGSELLLLMGFVIGVSVAALASGETADGAAPEPLPATVSVAAPPRDLPADLAGRELRIEQLDPLPFPDLVGRVAGLMGVEASVEERPGRVSGEHVVRGPPVPFGLVMTGMAPALLDELARLSGYDWTWAEGRVVFFRHADSEQREALRLPSGVAVDLLAALAENEEEAAHAERDPEGRLASGVPGRVEAGPGGRLDAAARAALEGQGPPAPAERAPPEPAGWEVIPAEHGTVEGVLRAWAERAGWHLAWETERQFGVGAAAVFEGGASKEEGFLAAADALLAISPMRRALSVTAYPNKWLVVRDVGTAAP